MTTTASACSTKTTDLLCGRDGVGYVPGMTDIPNNAMPTEEQFLMRELINKLAREETPLTHGELIKVGPFVQIVRDEVVEVASTPAEHKTTEDGRVVETRPRVGGSITKTAYYMLNERGLKLKFMWDRGQLDKLLD